MSRWSESPEESWETLMVIMLLAPRVEHRMSGCSEGFQENLLEAQCMMHMNSVGMKDLP